MQTKRNIDVKFYPGWTRKALTFTIDDGHIDTDGKFLDIVRPAGILGTFNLCHTNSLSPEEYRELYRGYEIANHCKHHPRTFPDGTRYVVSEEAFDVNGGEDYTEENPVVYKTNIDGLYYYHPYRNIQRPSGWYTVAAPDFYIRFVDQTREELEAVFGAGSIGAYVWPSCKQNNTAVREHLLSAGYYAIRKTGDVLDATGFSLPKDLTDWSYNARETNLLTVMEKYEQYADDGELKFFCLGLHSHDYEHSQKWDDLREFASKYGNRPNDYYYATNAQIFEYAAAIEKILITDTEITNPTDKSLYIKVDGECVLLKPNSTYNIKKA